MTVSLPVSFSRRHLFVAGTLGIASLASLATIAPASAADEVWTEEFMTRSENREGFLVDAMDEWQIENAKLIIAVAAGHGIGIEGARIALITAIVESWLHNYEAAVDADSGGLFQQRPSQGWGSYSEVRHKKKAIDAFLGFGDHCAAPGLVQAVPGYQTWEPGAAAQAVQASAYPERYSAQLGAAQTIWDRYAHEVTPYTA